MSKVIVGLSGGVDSAVAAKMLLDEGHEVEALFMKNWEEDDTEEYCSASVDLADAEQVADQLGIALHTVNFSSEYWDRVFEHFLAEYRAGRTPNPDVLCNTEIKFHAFLDHAVALGADHIATGHYAARSTDEQGHHLLKAHDHDKDQTYFLHGLTQQQLAPALFPLGEIPKSRVRELAREAGFDNHAKKDSTGICFIGERRFSDFLAQYLPGQPGDIETLDGDKVGTHNGLMYYTPGQRKGLGIGGVKTADEAPWFVIGKDLESNTLLVGQGHDHPALFHEELLAEKAHWILGPPDGTELRCSAKIRHRQSEQGCDVRLMGDDRIGVRFDEPQRAIAAGQYVVFYDRKQCLGGAVITEAKNG